MEHLTDAELRNFTVGMLHADDLLRADDHLSGCDQCRMRAIALSDASRYIDEFQADLIAPTVHLSDEELQLLAQGGLPGGAKDVLLRHLKGCLVCAGQVEDLRSWAPPETIARTNNRWLAIAAAVLLVLIPATLWKAGVCPQNTSTSLMGLDALDAPAQARVQRALNVGAAALPDFIADINSGREVLMGSQAKRGDTLVLKAPVGTGTISDRPRFEWQTLDGAVGYTVTVFDERSNVVARSPMLEGVNWTPADPLPRDGTYVWQVSTHRGRETITAPAAPAPPARFHVIDAHSAEVLRQIETKHPQSHLLLGILNMEAGIRDTAIAHLRQVSTSDVHADIARRSLERLQALNPPQQTH